MRKANNKNIDNKLEINKTRGVNGKTHSLLFLSLFISLFMVFTLSATSCDDTPPVYEEGGTESLLEDEEDTNEDETQQEVEDDFSFTISDDTIGEWSSPQTGLAIFGDRVIAPGDKGSYSFSITNNSNVDVVINIDLIEANEFGVAFCYRLNGEAGYIVSEPYYPIEHTSDDAIFASDIIINGKETLSLTLEWEWDDNYKDGEGDINDTAAGESGKTDFYSLTISVTGIFDDGSDTDIDE